jgi:hypothetical protein
VYASDPHGFFAPNVWPDEPVLAGDHLMAKVLGPRTLTRSSRRHGRGTVALGLTAAPAEYRGPDDSTQDDSEQ